MHIRRVILLGFGLTVLLMAVRRLRHYRLKERHALLFLLTGLPFFVLAVWQDAIGWLGKRLGIEYQTVSLMCVAAFLLLMVFELLTIVSLQDRKISTLAQIVGIMMEKHGMSDRPGQEATASPAPLPGLTTPFPPAESPTSPEPVTASHASDA